MTCDPYRSSVVAGSASFDRLLKTMSAVTIDLAGSICVCDAHVRVRASMSTACVYGLISEPAMLLQPQNHPV